MGRAGSIRGKIRMIQLQPVVTNSDRDSFTTGEGPGSPDVEVGTGADAVGLTVLEMPLLIEVGIVGFEGVRAMQLFRPAGDGTTGQNFGQIREALGFAGGGPRIGRLQNEDVGSNGPCQLQRPAVDQTVQVRS